MAANTAFLKRCDTKSCDSYDANVSNSGMDAGGGASGKRAWLQRADNQDRPITALLEAAFEQAFPRYLTFRPTIGELNRLTPSWVRPFGGARGVYFLG